MILNYKLIGRVMATVLQVLSVSMIPALGISLFYGEVAAIKGFLFSILPMFLCGTFLAWRLRDLQSTIRIRDGFLIVGLSWIVASTFGALPFFLSGEIPNPADAFFETASGFTTTGASILTEIESLSKGILFWRSFTHWLGGMGILIFTIALMPSLGIGGFRIAEAEAPGPTLDKLTPKMSDSAKILYIMYVGMTAIETVLLLLGGLDLFDALIHTFGTVGTGGFSSYNNSVGHYQSLYIEIIITLFMMLAGTNFNLYYFALRRKWKEFFADRELRAYWLIFLAATVVIALSLYIYDTVDSIGQAFRYASFQVASILTTTGYATTDFNLWPTTGKAILLLLMFIGGSSGSTSGSIKVIRIVIFFKLIRRGIYKRLHPTAVVPIKLGGRNVSADVVSEIVSFFFLYIGLFILGALVVSLENVDLITAISSSAACIGNIGPGFELVGPMANYSLFSDGTTIFLGLLMIAGRLELFTILLLLMPTFWNPDR